MNLLKWVCLIAQTTWIPPGLGLYHELSMQTFAENITEDAFFGYSITYQPQSKRLIVSAPKHGNIGEVYSCDIDKKTCFKIAHEINRRYKTYENNIWLGATVKAGPTFVVTCAPLYVDNYKYIHVQTRVGTFGHCYSLTDSSAHLEELSGIDQAEREKHTDKFEQAMDSFGWSLDVAPDNSVLVGSPAMFTGRVMKYQSLNDVPVGINGFEVGETFNFGYNIVSGYFFNEHTLIHAISSPYRYGVVKFFDKTLSYLRRILDKGADKNVVGSMYGAVMCSAFMTLNGRNDLLVGAPTYAYDNLYDVGAVYVYIPVKYSKLSFKRKIIGRKEGSYFGSAIVTVGDLNGDFKDEIAIAAPYEDEGRGTVYLYSGHDIISNNIVLKEVQRIQSEEHRAFGLSLTALNDYDENGCNELAIGAPGNNKVALLRCMAAVVVEIVAVFPDLKNRGNITHSYSDKNETYFVFQSCMNVKYPNKPKNVIGNIKIKVEINHPSAKLANPGNDSVYNVFLDRNNTVKCKKIGVILPPEGDYNTEIGYKISASQVNSPLYNIDFEASRVIVSDRSALSITGTVWAAECKVNKACLPDLKIDEIITDIPYTTDSYQYIIGSTESKDISIKISNDGDIAYSWCVRVRMQGAPVMGMPPPPNFCEYVGADSNEIKCSSQQRLPNNKFWIMGPIVIDMANLTSNDTQILINVDLYNFCKVNDSAVSQVVTIRLKGDTEGVILDGTAINGGNGIVNITKSEAEVDGKGLDHIYKVKNSVTDWASGINCTIEVERKPYFKYSGVPVLHYKNSHYECTEQREDGDTLYAFCSVDKFEKKTEFTVVVPMEVAPDISLGHKIETENVTVGSKLIVNINGTLKSHNINITLKLLPEATTPLWIIVLSVLFALLLLVIIALVLRKFGFLRRKNRENLKQVRKSVRRQSMRHSGRRDDVQKLVETDDMNDEPVSSNEDKKTEGQVPK